MAHRYTQQEKQQAVAAVAADASLADVAAERGISVSTLRRWLKAAGQASSPAASAAARRSSKSAAAQVPADKVQLVVIDAAGDTRKITRILQNEGLPVEVSGLGEHAYGRFVPDHAVWRKSVYIIDLKDKSAQRVFDLMRRSGKDFALVLVGKLARIQSAVKASEPVYMTAVEEDALELLGPALEREYQAVVQRTRLKQVELQARQRLQCCYRAFDVSPSPIAVVGASGHRYANAAYLKLFAVSSFEELRDVPFISLIEDSAHAEVLPLLDQLTAAGASESVQLKVRAGWQVTLDVSRLPGTAREIQLVFRSVQGAQGNGMASRELATVTPAPSGEQVADQALWAGRIRRALEDDSLFSAVYQPIVSLCGGSSRSYEVLLRMYDRKGGEHLPGSFIPAAEQSGLMGRVDQWVIAHAIRLVRDARRRDELLTIFVNLSPNSLFSTAFPDWLRTTLDDAGVEGGQLALEVSRADLATDLAAAQQALRAIRASGCAVVLDHFDSGAVRDNLLQQVEVDYLKIDRSLVLEVSRSEAHTDSVKTIVNAAELASVKTIAGHVQEAESVSRLWRCGVDYVQGYFLQHPSRALDYDFGVEDEEEEMVGRVGA